jgi:hypothetical protein
LESYTRVNETVIPAEIKITRRRIISCDNSSILTRGSGDTDLVYEELQNELKSGSCIITQMFLSILLMFRPRLFMGNIQIVTECIKTVMQV